MTPEQIARIGAGMQFERQSQEQQGMGLGLAIVQRLLQLYNGSLQIDSTPNQQTHVLVVLPRAHGEEGEIDFRF
jgi:signal transduction histidine kinase